MNGTRWHRKNDLHSNQKPHESVKSYVNLLQSNPLTQLTQQSTKTPNGPRRSSNNVKPRVSRKPSTGNITSPLFSLPFPHENLLKENKYCKEVFEIKNLSPLNFGYFT